MLPDTDLEHVVLVVRDQRLGPREYVDAMRTFGVPARQNHSAEFLDGFPEIWAMDSRNAVARSRDEPVPFGASCWHTDHTNQLQPPKIAALYTVRLPLEGGDTSFADAYLLYEHLPAALRARSDPLKTVNGADRHLPYREEDRDAFAVPAVHPMVRTHPETGRRALYCHPLKTHCIEGMTPEASFALIDEVLAAALRPEFVYRRRWRDGDLVLIDNRASLHRAERDYDPGFGRIMHRIIVEGDRPA